MTRRRSRAVRAAALALAALALAGCGGGSPDEEPTDGPVTALAPSGDQASATVRATRGAGTAVAACPPVAAAPKVRKGLPDLTLGCLGPGPSTRLSALRGPLLLNVWASWCGPCADETPYLVEARRSLAGKVTFLGIDLADKDTQARDWLSYMGVEWPSLQDPGEKVRSKLHIPGPPVTLFVRTDGTVADVHYGAFTSAREVASAVADHLGVTS